MSYYLVTTHGVGIEVATEGGGKPIVGFFATRLVGAASPADAELKVRSMIHADWKSDEYALTNKGSMPRLTVESIEPSSLFKRVFFKNRGHVFYPAE